MTKFFAFLTASVFLCCGMAGAQDSAKPAQKPIEITATKDVEWQRNEKKYIARDNVIVTQGATTIKCDLLTADYRDGATSSMEIWQMTAEQNVTISDGKNTAYGDKGVYDVTAGIATLTGKNLKLVSPDQTVTADERMEYFANDKKARAIGNAKVVRAKDTLTAHTITAFFNDGDGAAKTPETGKNSPLGGSGSLDRLEAEGRVIIKTPTETLYGDKAIYKAATNTAELIGHVRVERDKNMLEGARAQINLTTNVSKMFGGEKDGGRVRGVFFPSPSHESLLKPKTPLAPENTPVTLTPEKTY